jgi:small-conductance mechanosensitive channel
MCLLGAALIVALIALFVYVCIKDPKVLVITLFVAIILTGLVIAPTVAETQFREVQGYILKVAPEYFDNYPVLVVTVETVEGEVYLYYAEDEIDVQGVVTLLLFGNEVIDVI